MRDNKNDWLDNISNDDLRSRLLKNTIPARDGPKTTKKSKLSHRFKRSLPKKLDNPVDTDKVGKNPKNVQVTVNLGLPRIQYRKYWKQYKASTYAKVTTVIVLVIVVNVFVVSFIRGSSDGDTKGANTSDGRSKSADYQALLPGGSEANTTSGKAAYDPEKQVTSFADKIGENDITISQQPLPPDFKDNPDGRVEIFAKNSNFNDLLQVKDGRAHLGTSIKGPQSVVFHKKGLLVFLKSDKKILNSDWIRYIDNLKPKEK